VRTLSLILIAFSLAACTEKPKITSATVLNESPEYGLPIKLCLSKEFGEIYNAKIRIESKSGLTLERSDIKISNYSSDKNLCSHLNIYVSLLPKRSPEKSYREIKENIFPGNIKSLDIRISDNHGFFYEEAREFTSFKAENL
jgi:hypothetical protein